MNGIKLRGRYPDRICAMENLILDDSSMGQVIDFNVMQDRNPGAFNLFCQVCEKGMIEVVEDGVVSEAEIGWANCKLCALTIMEKTLNVPKITSYA